jgi:hypothetical protein
MGGVGKNGQGSRGAGVNDCERIPPVEIPK